MKTNLQKISLITALLLAGSLLSCNKESLIEGIIPDVPINNEALIIGKKVSLSNISGGILDAGYLIIAGDSFKLSFLTNRIYGLSSLYFSPTDSIRLNYLSVSSTPSGATCYLKTDYNSIIQFKTGDTIPNYFAATSAYPLFLASRKSYPYTTPYSNTDTFFAIGSNYYKPKFFLNQNGYLTFKMTKNASSKITNYYGWIHVVVGPDSVLFDSYKYKKEDRPLVGK